MKLEVFNNRPDARASINAPLRYKSPQGADNHATQVWVVVEPGGQVRRAEFIGSESRSRLTQYVYWVEEKAVLARRAGEAAHAIRSVCEGVSDSPDIWVVWSGIHCLYPVGSFHVYDPALIKTYCRQWLSWRKNQYAPLPEAPEDPEGARHFWFAKWASREYEPGYRLTDGEGIALNRFKDAVLEVLSDRMVITVPSLGIKAQQTFDLPYWEILPLQEEDPDHDTGSDHDQGEPDQGEFVEVTE